MGHFLVRDVSGTLWLGERPLLPEETRESINTYLELSGSTCGTLSSRLPTCAPNSRVGTARCSRLRRVLTRPRTSRPTTSLAFRARRAPNQRTSGRPLDVDPGSCRGALTVFLGAGSGPTVRSRSLLGEGRVPAGDGACPGPLIGHESDREQRPARPGALPRSGRRSRTGRPWRAVAPWRAPLRRTPLSSSGRVERTRRERARAGPGARRLGSSSGSWTSMNSPCGSRTIRPVSRPCRTRSRSRRCRPRQTRLVTQNAIGGAAMIRI